MQRYKFESNSQPRKFYASFMNLKEFMADSIGRQFVGMVSDALDADKMRRNSQYYQAH